MAEEFARNRQYEYRANSNLVLTADRDKRRPADEATGEVESLHGKIANQRMGDKSRPGTGGAELEEKLKKAKAKRERVDKAAEDEKNKRKKRQKVFVAGTGSTVLTETDELEAINYRPKTRESKSAYESILAVVQGSIGDQPQDVLRGAADEVLALLKDDKLRDPERQGEAEKLLGKMAPDRFNKLVNMGKQITDFATDGDKQDAEDEEEEQLDEEMGVAVVFDDDEEEEEEEDIDEVRDEEEEDEDALHGVEAMASSKLVKGADSDDEGEYQDDQYTLNVQEIDAHWLQRKLSEYYDDANMSAKLAEDVIEILSLTDERDCENKLVVLLDYEKFDLIKILLRNRAKVFYCTRIKQAQDEDEKQKIQEEMMDDTISGGPAILEAMQQTATADSWVQDRMQEFRNKSMREAAQLKNLDQNDEAMAAEMDKFIKGNAQALADSQGGPRPQEVVDLESLSFVQAGHLMSNKRCELPDKSWRAQKKGYEEVHVPASVHVPTGEKLIPIADLPEWSQAAFKGMKSLNRIQSKMKPVALESSENLLLCAPTGAGKTNVAVMCMLNVLGQYRKEGGGYDLDAFKIVYVAPMKALVQECVVNFGKKLEPYGIKVKELSGDQSLTRAEIAETHVIVTTPEKWDIITRKSGERTYTQLVRLLIIDEIHLLHDERGPVLESIAARTIRQVETTHEMVRIVGLSATLPNYEDVATFLRVDPSKGLFFFDNSFRPVPLQQQYIGITEKKALKRFQVMNEICYEKVMTQAGKNQILIFCHSRAECAKTAAALRDMAVDKDTINHFISEGTATSEILREESDRASNADLKDLLAYGFAIHHAGMTRDDRNMVEDLYSDKHIQVLCCTATLAWGVNLPAHTVIIKGTQMYSPEKGKWCELSPLDIMQMLGRAGRPGFDTEGEGIIITQHSELQYYLSLMNQQLPIESQLIAKLPDMLNAEIVMGSVQNVRDAAEWLSYTYLYVRMLRNGELYGVSAKEAEDDEQLLQRRMDLAHSAALTLDKHHMCKYDRKTGAFQVTALGRVASAYYVGHESMATYNEYLKPTMSDIELFRLFSLSGEFQFIHVREEEKIELNKLAARVPIPVKESVEEPSAKVNILLQAYISNLKLEGFALVADLTYVRQSAVRLMRCLFDIALKRGWAALAEKALNLCKMVERKMWLSQSPLRQFKALPESIARKLEKKDIPWERYYDLKPADLGELVKIPKMGKLLHAFVHKFPRLELSAHVQPITRSLLRVELTITPDFEFDVKVHDYAQLFHVIVTDVDGEKILHHEPFMLKQRYANEEHTVHFSVPMFEPLPPQYFLKVVSDRWMHAETTLPISFRNLIMPHKFPPHTELLDLQPQPVTALREPKYEQLYAHLKSKTFNPIQTQTFTQLYETDENVLVCAPTGSGKTICAEFALLRMLASAPKGTKPRCVYVAPKPAIANSRFADWSKRFGDNLGLEVTQLTGETAADLKLLERGQVVIATAEQWDVVSRRWKQRKNVQDVALYICDEVHLIGGSEGPTLEVVLSRMRYVASQTDKSARIVALGTSMANAKDVGDWLGASGHSLFSFHPQVRPVPLEMFLHGLDTAHFGSRMLAMSKPAFSALMGHANKDPVLIFVPSRKQCQLTAIDIMTYAAAAGDAERFLHTDEATLAPILEAGIIKDPALLQTLPKGIGFVHSGMGEKERSRVEALYADGIIQLLIAPANMCWELTVTAQLVLIMDTVSYDGRDHRYVDYPITDMLQMVGKAGRPLIGDEAGKCVIFCHSPKKEHLKRLLYEPLPIESHLDHFLHDHLNAEVVTKTIENKQDAVDYVTWTLYYRRLAHNPNYYNLQGVTHRHLSDHLSELVENVVNDLEESRAVAVEDDVGLSALNLGMIAAYYYIAYTTVELFASSLTDKTKLKGLLEILTASSEYDMLPVRQYEERSLQALSVHLPQKLADGAKFSDPHTKALVLLQAHFSRQALSLDLAADRNVVLGSALKLLQALVDVISSNGWLKPALVAMESSQMVVQGLWDRDHPLMQLPHFSKAIVARCQAHEEEIDTVFDIMGLEDDVRDSLLQLSPAQMADVAHFCNNYPNIDLEYDVADADEVETGDAVQMTVTLEREVDEDMDASTIGQVSAPRYPKPKVEGWWLVVGDVKRNSLLCIKRIALQKSAKVKLDFVAPDEAGDYKLTLYFMCDSYLGCDQEYEFDLSVAQGDSDEEEDSDGDSDGMEEE